MIIFHRGDVITKDNIEAIICTRQSTMNRDFISRSLPFTQMNNLTFLAERQCSKQRNFSEDFIRNLKVCNLQADDITGTQK